MILVYDDYEYKVKYEDNKGGHVTDWMIYQQARRYFEKLRNEKVLQTKWAELIYSPVAEDAEDEERVVDQFTRKEVEILGHKFLVS